MTNEEAIKRIHRFVEMYKICGKDNYHPTTNITKSDYEAFKVVTKLLEQQPCEDCISRENAINNLKLAYFDKDIQSAKNDPCVIDAMIDWAIRIVKALPSVQPQQRWIPISERLPEPYQECLFTVEAFRWEYEPITYKVIQKAYGGETNIIAWMPLPEPYKVEREE